MAKAKGFQKAKTRKKVTSIGNGTFSRPQKAKKNRTKKKYRGQGK